MTNLTKRAYDVNTKIIEDETGMIVGFLLRMSTWHHWCHKHSMSHYTSETFHRAQAAFSKFKDVYVA